MDAEKKELLEQLKLVTRELAYQIAAQYQDITLEQIEKKNPIVRDALDTIDKYESKQIKTPEEIIAIVQENMDSGDGISDDFFEYVHTCEDLTDEEKEWADENLGMHLVVEQI